MLGEPQRTEYDWNFQIFGIPCRVHPFFWLLAVMLGIRGNSSQGILIWVSVVFVSILVHELGHAFTIRYFGWSPRVVLHSFGGLAIYDPSFSPWQSGRRTTPHNLVADPYQSCRSGSGLCTCPVGGRIAVCIAPRDSIPFLRGISGTGNGNGIGLGISAPKDDLHRRLRC